MKTAREIVRENQLVCPKDYHKRYYIIKRDPIWGDLAAEVCLSGWDGDWLVAVYHSKLGPQHLLWKTGLETRGEAMAYVQELKDAQNS